MTLSSAQASANVAREWAERNKPYVPPTVPPPVQRAKRVTFDAVRQVKPTKKLRAGDVKSITFSDEIGQSPTGFVKRLLNAGGWEIVITKAIGTWTDVSGKPATKRIMEEVGGAATPTGRAKTEKVGEEVLGPQDSVLVRALVRGSDGVSRMLWGHWVGGSFEDGGDWHRGRGNEMLPLTEGIMKRADNA